MKILYSIDTKHASTDTTTNVWTN